MELEPRSLQHRVPYDRFLVLVAECWGTNEIPEVIRSDTFWSGAVQEAAYWLGVDEYRNIEDRESSQAHLHALFSKLDQLERSESPLPLANGTHADTAKKIDSLLKKARSIVYQQDSQLTGFEIPTAATLPNFEVLTSLSEDIHNEPAEPEGLPALFNNFPKPRTPSPPIIRTLEEILAFRRKQHEEEAAAKALAMISPPVVRDLAAEEAENTIVEEMFEKYVNRSPDTDSFVQDTTTPSNLLQPNLESASTMADYLATVAKQEKPEAALQGDIVNKAAEVAAKKAEAGGIDPVTTFNIGRDTPNITSMATGELQKTSMEGSNVSNAVGGGPSKQIAYGGSESQQGLCAPEIFDDTAGGLAEQVGRPEEACADYLDHCSDSRSPAITNTCQTGENENLGDTVREIAMNTGVMGIDEGNTCRRYEEPFSDMDSSAAIMQSGEQSTSVTKTIKESPQRLQSPDRVETEAAESEEVVVTGDNSIIDEEETEYDNDDHYSDRASEYSEETARLMRKVRSAPYLKQSRVAIGIAINQQIENRPAWTYSFHNEDNTGLMDILAEAVRSGRITQEQINIVSEQERYKAPEHTEEDEESTQSDPTEETETEYDEDDHDESGDFMNPGCSSDIDGDDDEVQEKNAMGEDVPGQEDDSEATIFDDRNRSDLLEADTKSVEGSATSSILNTPIRPGISGDGSSGSSTPTTTNDYGMPKRLAILPARIWKTHAVGTRRTSGAPHVLYEHRIHFAAGTTVYRWSESPELEDTSASLPVLGSNPVMIERKAEPLTGSVNIATQTDLQDATKQAPNDFIFKKPVLKKFVEENYAPAQVVKAPVLQVRTRPIRQSIRQAITRSLQDDVRGIKRGFNKLNNDTDDGRRKNQYPATKARKKAKTVQEDVVMKDVGDESNESVYRCICGVAEDSDEYMVQCDTCKLWQHSICMGLPADERSMSMNYECHECVPAAHPCTILAVEAGRFIWEERQVERYGKVVLTSRR